MKDFKSFSLLTFFILIVAFIGCSIIFTIKGYLTDDSDFESITYGGDITYILNQETSEFEPVHNEYKFIKVIDGDTVKLKDSKGNDISLRMIGLDAPEKSTTRYGYVECFGVEATEHLENLLQGAEIVGVETDSSQTLTDQYGRLLGYLWYGGSNINLDMIKDGYGWEYTFNLPYKYQKDFQLAEKYAEEHELGLRNKDTCNGERDIAE